MSDTGQDSGAPSGPAGPASSDEERALDLAHRLFDHARTGRRAQLCAYLDHGLPVDAADTDGNTLLALAAYHGHPGTVRALLARGADPDRRNARGRTPLAAAVFNGRLDVVAALVAGQADPYVGSPNAEEAARFLGRPDLLEALGVEESEEPIA